MSSASDSSGKSSPGEEMFLAVCRKKSSKSNKQKNKKKLEDLKLETPIKRSDAEYTMYEQ